MKIHLNVLLALAAIIALTHSAAAEAPAGKTTAPAAVAAEAPQKLSSISGQVVIQGTNAAIKNSRNAYSAQGKSLEEMKKYEGMDVKVKGYVSEANGTKQILIKTIKSDAAQTPANNLVAKLNK